MAGITVITADIIDSRSHPEECLRTLGGRLEKIVHPMLATEFTISRGDELQGVCRGILAAPELIRWLRYACRPFVLRIGVGIGPAPATMERSSWNMSGEAFFRARAALDVLKPGKRPRTFLISGEDRLDTIANAVFDLIDAVLSRWTAGQWEAVAAYEREGRFEAAGRALGVALQNVEKRCRAAHWQAVRAGEEALGRLGEWFEGGALFTPPGVIPRPSPAER